MKRIRVTDESLNTYGFWVLTKGIDTSDFMKNPIMLWNHNRGWRGTEDEVLPIGIWKDLELKGSEMSAMPEIDTDDSFSSRISKKFEKGHLTAASIGIQILEWSEDPALLKPGQTRATVTKCKLREISLVDIPSNKNAVVLYDLDGAVVNLSDDGSLPNLPTITSQPVQAEMNDFQTLAVSLGLLQTATLADVQAKIGSIQALAAENQSLKTQLKAFEDAQVESRKVEVKTLLDAAVSEGRLMQSQRPTFEKLFATDHDTAKEALLGLNKVVKLSDFPAGAAPGAAGKFTYDGKTFSELSRENPSVLASLKDNDIETFKKLYKAEFGKDYKVTER